MNNNEKQVDHEIIINIPQWHAITYNEKNVKMTKMNTSTNQAFHARHHVYAEFGDITIVILVI